MYNFKLIEYPNGSAQIRIYSKPMDVEHTATKSETEKIIEPFTGKVAKEVTEFTTPNKEEYLQKSIARSKQKISIYARSYKWQYFVTLTYSPEKIDRTDFSKCMRKTRDWLNNVRKRLAPDLKYLVVPELHADGVSWHCHMLLADIGKLNLTDSGIKRKGCTVYNISNWHYGFSTATEVVDTHRVQKYILKYITKESCALTFGKHRYYVSNNLPLPVESVMLVEPREQDELVQTLADSLGMEVVWKSNPTSGNYVDVTYIELQ